MKKVKSAGFTYVPFNFWTSSISHSVPEPNLHVMMNIVEKKSEHKKKKKIGKKRKK